MSFMTRAITAFAVLTTAAIPVGALTVKNSSSNDVSIAVDNGASEGVYTVPANGSVDVKEDCTSDCAVTGPWGFSRLVSQNATIETDGLSLVTAGAAQPAAGAAMPAATPAAEAATAPQQLIPQNPADDPAASSSAVATAPTRQVPVAKPQKPRRAAQARKQAKSAPKSDPGAGSFQMLFQGPSKK